MTEERFVELRRPDWDRYSVLLAELGRRATRKKGAEEFPALYRRICQDLNQAQADNYSPVTIELLNHLVWEGHQRLYRKSTAAKSPWYAVLFAEFPRRVRRHVRSVIIGHILFYGSMLFAFAYCSNIPGGYGRFLNAEARESLDAMYDPAAEHFLKPREVSGSADMFGYYIQHNISIGLQTFSGGAVAGIGSLLLVVFNGIYLGAVSAYMASKGFLGTFLPFVVTHGAFELTALILFGVAGLKLGWALISPGRLKRSDALAARASDVLPMIYGSSLFLVIAAGIEAFWSSLVLPPAAKYASGAFAWLLVAVFLVFGGRRRG